MTVSQDRLVFITSAGKLQDIAATKLALEFWRTKIDEGYSEDVECRRWFSSQTICAKEFVHVPQIIARIIDKQIELLRSDLKDWAYYNLSRIFFCCDHREAILRCIHEISFKSNCSIDHNETAKKLQQCKRLTSKEKSRISYVWRYFELDSRGTLMNRSTFGDTIWQIDYWYIDQIASRDCINIDSHWAKMSVREQYLYARRVFHEQPNNLIFLLPRMKVEALNRIINERGSQIVQAFARCARNVDYAFQTWLFLENRISRAQFFDMIITLLDYRSRMNNKNYYEDDYIDTLVQNIWSRAPSEFKEYLLIAENSGKIVAILCRQNEYFVKDLRRTFLFLLEFLSYKDFNSKNELWRRCWRDLIFGSRLSHLDELMRICLKDSNEVECFKDNFLCDFIANTSVRKYYNFLIKKRYHCELNAFLNFCTSGDKQKAAELKRDFLLRGNDEIYFIFNYYSEENLNEFDEFLCELLRDTDLIDEIKSKIIMLPENLAALCRKIENYDLLAVKNLLCCFLSSQSDLDELKSKYLNLCRSNLIEGKLYNFQVSKWQKFLEWCFDDDANEAAIRKFKESIAIDEIFTKALNRCVQWQSYLVQYNCRGSNRSNSFRGTAEKCDFYELSDFLEWYFKSPEKAFDFKMSKVREFKGFRRIRRQFEAESDDAYMILEDWFFEGWPDPYLSSCKI